MFEAWNVDRSIVNFSEDFCNLSDHATQETIMKKFWLTVMFVIAGLAPAIAGAETPLNIYFFRGEGCPHCAKEEVALLALKAKYPEIKVIDYEIYYQPENIKKLEQAAEILGVNVQGVPFTVIGDKTFVGFAEGVTEVAIESRIKECLADVCPDSLAVLEQTTAVKPNEIAVASSTVPALISVPLFGQLDLSNFPLPLLTIVLGGLDGFNPCAMWTLIFLISLLLGMADRRRMWILGGAFIVASALVYFAFMAAWLNLILFLGFVVWIRLVIGLLALGGGGWSLWGAYTKPAGTCDVTSGERQQRIFEKLRQIVSEQHFGLALIGIILLAFAVNLVELVCSAGLPAVYTQVLALNHLPAWQYYLYLGGYILIFMLDDLLVFVASMWALRLTGLSTRYSYWAKIIGGIVMVIIGLLLIFRPEILMFG